MDDREQQIVQGISLSPTGQATVDPSLADVLFDLAISLEELTGLPVDVEHVLAAIVMAARKSELNPRTKLAADNEALRQSLVPHVKIVFEVFGGDVSQEDSL